MSNSVFPPRHVYFPENEHGTTVIFLHDRSSTGPEVANYLSRVTSTFERTLYEHFPSTRWVFPSARAKHFYWTQADRQQLVETNKDNTTRWFEMASLKNVQLDSPEQLTTLQESATYILRIIDDEIERIKRVGGSSRSIFIAGTGQGAALGLVVLLCVHHELGGFVGVDGWMPSAETLSSLLDKDQVDDAGGFFKSTFLAAAEQAYIQQQKQQQAWTAYNSSSTGLSSPNVQPGNHPAETEVVTSMVVVPEYVKSMAICLGCSQRRRDLGRYELVAEAVDILKRMGFSRVLWKPQPENLDKGNVASGHDSTAVSPLETPEQVEEMVKFFKALDLAG